MKNNFRILIIDIDGVMTTGRFFYTEENGKFIKEFGSDDSDAISLLKPHIKNIQFVTGDKRGFAISSKRICEDMGYTINLVSTTQRSLWIKNKFNEINSVIYIGDGIFDHYVFKSVGYSIATANALPHVQERADYVTSRKGAEGAVAEAVLHILDKFFVSYDPDKPLPKNIKYSGTWQS
jgi:3-deoxy-D-manno-octulosonate 8-phosphate phosphatase (KDO 8-P phosphatase)